MPRRENETLEYFMRGLLRFRTQNRAYIDGLIEEPQESDLVLPPLDLGLSSDSLEELS